MAGAKSATPNDCTVMSDRHLCELDHCNHSVGGSAEPMPYVTQAELVEIVPEHRAMRLSRHQLTSEPH